MEKKHKIQYLQLFQFSPFSIFFIIKVSMEKQKDKQLNDNESPAF